MASQYSVIQYVPNPIADERVNIGVLAFNEQVVRVHFLHNWNRVRKFGNEDIGFLREFAEQMEESAARGLLFPGDRPGDIPKHERLIKVARGWINSIQFTEPCGSRADVDSLLEDAATTYLVDTLPEKPSLRDRQAASKIANVTVKTVLKARKGEQASDYFKTSLAGKHEDHKLDAVVANGRPYLAVHGLSFEVHPPKNVLIALTWAIIDVKNSLGDLPFGVLTLLPKPESKDFSELMSSYDHAVAKYIDWGAVILQEDELERWTNQTLVQANL
jgi:hypothetical protein